MEKTRDVSQGHKVDMPELLSRVDNDRELLRDLLMIFKDDFPRNLEDLRNVVTSQDMKAAKVVSHTLKGMLSNLGVTKAAAAAARRRCCGESVGGRLAQFEREVDGLLPEMEAYMEEVQS
jgi:HPt (histidine-containing phosphotransfer) domain-containing protein